uniref:Major facilitator superfamily domain containing 8-like 2 n=1 Tax=Oryzias latipes TaxID=8090 RepID=H2LYK4_ORYLA
MKGSKKTSTMDNTRKRNLTFFTIGLIFMLSGIEYAVILPTIWRYLQILEAPPYFLGLGLSAFSLSGLLTGPLFGFWSDRSKTTKSIILFSNLFEIAGNFMYFLGYSKWLLLCSRLVAGIGAGAGSSIFGFLTRSTLPEERAGIFAAVMACRQAGLLIGPAFNLFLRLCDFKLGPFAVNKYTSPGIFMCLLWLLLQFVVLALYWDVPPIKSEEEGLRMEMKQEDEEEEAPLIRGDEQLAHTYRAVNLDHCYQTSLFIKKSIFLMHFHCFFKTDVLQKDFVTPVKVRVKRSLGLSVCAEFLREEVVVVLTAQFITLFNQTALETMVTPMTQRYFSFGELGNSLMYSLCGVEVILGFFFVRWLSGKVADRAVLAGGLVICCFACVWCLVFLCNPRGGYGWELTAFIIGVFLQLLGLPFVAVSATDCCSVCMMVTKKNVKTDRLWFSQGVRRSVGGLATILGPLWAGGLINNLYVMLGMMLVLLLMVTVSRISSLDSLQVVQCGQSSDSGG